MANINETAIWQPTVNQIEVDEFIGGGENGLLNQSQREIANRTQWLKQQFDTINVKLTELEAKNTTPTTQV